MQNRNSMGNPPIPEYRDILQRETDLLDTVSFYHPGTTRHMAESMLLQNGVDGTYLMRPSSKPGEIVLSVRCKDSVKHFPVKWDGNLFHFGAGTFGSMKSMVKHFNSRPMIGSESGILTTLKHPYPREVAEPTYYDSVKVHATFHSNRSSTEDTTPDFTLASKEGFLTKEGRIVKNWKIRWFTLRKNELRYYRNKKDNRPVKTLDLSQCTACIRDNTHGKDYCFSLTFPARTFYIHAATEEEMTEWMKLLNWKLRHRTTSVASSTEPADTTPVSSTSSSSATSSLSSGDCNVDGAIIADVTARCLDVAHPNSDRSRANSDRSSANSDTSSGNSDTSSSASENERNQPIMNTYKAQYPTRKWYVAIDIDD